MYPMPKLTLAKRETMGKKEKRKEKAWSPVFPNLSSLPSPSQPLVARCPFTRFLLFAHGHTRLRCPSKCWTHRLINRNWFLSEPLPPITTLKPSPLTLSSHCHCGDGIPSSSASSSPSHHAIVDSHWNNHSKPSLLTAYLNSQPISTTPHQLPPLSRA